MTLVHMLNSVADYVAGEDYDLPVEEADRFILRGYAEGELSREYTTEELDAIHAGHQEVSLGG